MNYKEPVDHCDPIKYNSIFVILSFLILTGFIFNSLYHLDNQELAKI